MNQHPVRRCRRRFVEGLKKTSWLYHRRRINFIPAISICLVWLSGDSIKRNKRKRGSKSRRKLAKREGKQHQKIARSRKDFQYKTAHKIVRTLKKYFFYEDLNLKGLTRRNKTKQDEDGNYQQTGQSAKSGLNKSWADGAFGQFFEILQCIAEKAGAVAISQKPQYTSMILSYRNEIIFTDCSIREYWDEQNSLMVDRDINAAINLKRLGLGIFPSIKRRSGKIDIVGTMDDSTTKEILHTLYRAVGSLHLPQAVSVGVCHESLSNS